MQMLQDPWYNASQQFGNGIGNYLQQATDRSLFRDNLSRAKQLMQPRQDAQGNQVPLSPSEMLFGLYEASGGNPAFINSIGEIFPTMIKEQQRMAGLSGNQRPGNRPQQSPMQQPPQQDPRLTSQMQPRTSMMQPQQDQFQGNQGTDGNIQSAINQNQAQYPQAQSNQEGQADFLEPFGPKHPEWKTLSPEEIQQVTDNTLNAGGTQDLVETKLNRMQNAYDKENAARQAYYDNKRADQIATRNMTKEQASFLDSQRSTSKPEWNEDPYMKAYTDREFLKELGNPKHKSDLSRWEAVRNKGTRVQNLRSQISSGTGRPWLWESMPEKVNAARLATKPFIESGRLPGGQIDQDTIEEAITQNMKNDWGREEATAISLPPSKGFENVITSAPVMSRMRGGDGEVRDQNRLNQVYDTMANRFMQKMGPYDSLLVARKELERLKGFSAADANAIFDRMEAQGFKFSPFQESEKGHLQEGIFPSLTEIFNGATSLKSFRESIKPSEIIKGK